MAYWVNILTNIGIASIGALGLYITMSTGQLSVGHAAFYGLGAYISGYLTANGVPFAGAVLVAVLACGALGLVAGALFLRLSQWILAAATLGFAEAVRVVVLNMEPLGGARGFHGAPLVASFGMVCAFLVAVLFIIWRLEGSRLGAAFHMVKEDETVAAAMGVNVRWVRTLSFALGAAVVSVAGVLHMHYVGIAQPKDIGFEQSLDFLISVAVGGIHTFLGPVLGSFVLHLLPELLRFSLYDRYLLLGGALTLIVILRPQGILIRRPWRPHASLLERALGTVWPTYEVQYEKFVAQHQGGRTE